MESKESLVFLLNFQVAILSAVSHGNGYLLEVVHQGQARGIVRQGNGWGILGGVLSLWGPSISPGQEADKKVRR